MKTPNVLESLWAIEQRAASRVEARCWTPAKNAELQGHHKDNKCYERQIESPDFRKTGTGGVHVDLLRSR